MIRIFLNQFFKSFSEKNKERFKSYLDNYVRNPALFEELLLIYNFKNKWRDKIGYSIKKERYKIIEYNITKNNTGIKIEVKLLHRFITSIPPYETKSIEKCEYIIFLKKSLFSYKIVDLYNKEY